MGGRGGYYLFCMTQRPFVNASPFRIYRTEAELTFFANKISISYRGIYLHAFRIFFGTASERFVCTLHCLHEASSSLVLCVCASGTSPRHVTSRHGSARHGTARYGPAFALNIEIKWRKRILRILVLDKKKFIVFLHSIEFY